MKHRVPHDLDDDMARKACDAAIGAYRERFPEFSPQATWVDDRTCKVKFSAKGVSLNGKIELARGAVLMDLDVPLVFRFLKKKAIEVIESEIKAWVAKARSGEV